MKDCGGVPAGSLGLISQIGDLVEQPVSLFRLDVLVCEARSHLGRHPREGSAVSSGPSFNPEAISLNPLPPLALALSLCQEQQLRQQQSVLRQFEHRLTLGIASCDETCWPPSSSRRAVHASQNPSIVSHDDGRRHHQRTTGKRVQPWKGHPLGFRQRSHLRATLVSQNTSSSLLLLLFRTGTFKGIFNWRPSVPRRWEPFRPKLTLNFFVLGFGSACPQVFFLEGGGRRKPQQVGRTEGRGSHDGGKFGPKNGHRRVGEGPGGGAGGFEPLPGTLKVLAPEQARIAFFRISTLGTLRETMVMLWMPSCLPRVGSDPCTRSPQDIATALGHGHGQNCPTALGAFARAACTMQTC